MRYELIRGPCSLCTSSILGKAQHAVERCFYAGEKSIDIKARMILEIFAVHSDHGGGSEPLCVLDKMHPAIRT
jgi:hypothetical protein